MLCVVPLTSNVIVNKQCVCLPATRSIVTRFAAVAELLARQAAWKSASMRGAGGKCPEKCFPILSIS